MRRFFGSVYDSFGGGTRHDEIHALLKCGFQSGQVRQRHGPNASGSNCCVEAIIANAYTVDASLWAEEVGNEPRAIT